MSVLEAVSHLDDYEGPSREPSRPDPGPRLVVAIAAGLMVAALASWALTRSSGDGNTTEAVPATDLAQVTTPNVETPAPAEATTPTVAAAAPAPTADPAVAAAELVDGFAAAWTGADWEAMAQLSTASVVETARAAHRDGSGVAVVDPIGSLGGEFLVTDPAGGSASIFAYELGQVDGHLVVTGLVPAGDAG